MKYIKYLSIALLINLIGILNVSAATANVSVYSNLATVVVGNQVNITFQLSSTSALGSWAYQISYDSSKFNFKSCSNGQSLTQVGYVSNGNTKTTSVTCYFNAKASGTGTFTLRNADIVAWDESKMGVSNSSKSVKVITQAELEASYSKNNNLSSLSITGNNITPSFNKDTLEYNLEVENDIRKITINATKEDNKSSITGTGEKDLTEGLNKFAIVVTAQNGSKKTYTVNITVKELTPIIVKIDSKDYTVVRKKDLLKSPNAYYQDTTIKIEDFDIPAFINETIGYTLVGLKDSDNNINLFVYNKDNNTYREYKETTFNQLILEMVNNDEKMPGNYKRVTITMNDEEIEGYKLDIKSKYSLIYARNIETGEYNIYMYDSIENTIQRYNTEEVNKLNEELNETKTLYEYIIMGIGGFLILTYLVFLISLISKEKKRKKSIQENNRPSIVEEEKKDKVDIKEENTIDDASEILEDDKKSNKRKSRKK